MGIVCVVSADDVTKDLSANLASLADAPRYKPGPPCSASLTLKAIEARDPDQLDVVKHLIDAPEVSATTLAEKLRASGYQVKPQALSRHRRRGQVNGCRCAR